MADDSTPDLTAVREALGEISTDAGTLASWAEEVLADIESGDLDAAAEAGGYVEAMMNYTSRIELVEAWAEKHTESEPRE